MPSQLAHILLGNQALHSLPSAWTARLDQGAFRLGCQGPDVFYHNRRSKPGAFLYGTRLHRRGWGSYLAGLRREALERGWEPEHPGLSFLVGQATHGFLDRTAHPFVVSFSGWMVPGLPLTQPLRHSHAFLERILDVQLWQKWVSPDLADCDWQEGLPGPRDFPGDFWTAWGNALHAVFPKLSSREDLEPRLKNAVADTVGFLGHTSPRNSDWARRAAEHGAIHYFHPIALPAWDFLNRARGPWLDPVTGATRHESFLDLFGQASEQASAALATLLDPGVDWEALMGNGSLNLPGESGENSAPAFSQPWDFASLYEREVRARLA